MIPIVVFDDRRPDGFEKEWESLISALDEVGMVLSELETPIILRDLVNKGKRLVCIIVHHSWLTDYSSPYLDAALSFVRRHHKTPFILFVTSDGFARPEKRALDDYFKKKAPVLYTRVHFPSDETLGSALSRAIREFVSRFLSRLEKISPDDISGEQLRKALQDAEQTVPSACLNPGESDTPGTLILGMPPASPGQAHARSGEEHCFRLWLLVHYARITLETSQSASAFRSTRLWQSVMRAFVKCPDTTSLQNVSLLAERVIKIKDNDDAGCEDVISVLRRENRGDELTKLLAKAERELEEKAALV